MGERQSGKLNYLDLVDSHVQRMSNAALQRTLILEEPGCTETDAELFFGGGGPMPKLAKQICNRCDVRDACLELALREDHANDFGARAGLTKSERKPLRKQRQDYIKQQKAS